ncbi:acetaldehyde dehydrogenase (acetylating) [Cohnella suwonensis]|uniref:Acetaldehyde dehydrogenase (Acetylating) n=1 Tax=Cohnella suwonensis TaxID=696072 RepID=A0ABW0LVE8_9BACL
MIFDADLMAIQETRQALSDAKDAQKQLARMTQGQIDAIVESMARAAEAEAATLGELAAEETGFGNPADKKAKNLFVARDVYGAIKDMPTVGIVRKDDARRVWEIAQPMGVVAAIVPSTNPTSTVIFKCLIALKARNAIVVSPHPSALRCSLEAARAMAKAAEKAGAPPGAISCLSRPSLEATQELMRHKLTDVVLATGGSAMVKAAYSSGKPAYGVGPGNVPVYVHRSADLSRAARLIVQSKTFDYGTICASEQAIVVDGDVKHRLKDELERQGAYFLSAAEKAKVAGVLLAPSGRGMNPSVVGRSPKVIAERAGIAIPEGARVLVGEETEVGLKHPFSTEKLCSVLALYEVRDWREGSVRCNELLELGGMGHTLGIHGEDPEVFEAFGLGMPASRIVVNGGTTFGGIGATTGLLPSMTLGCGSFGGNITTDNIGPMHLMNIKRVAFGIREMPDPEEDGLVRKTADRATSSAGGKMGISREEVTRIVRQLLDDMQIR